MIAVVVLAIGLILAVTPLSAGAGSDAVECGSALDPSYVQADIRDIVDHPMLGSYVTACEDEVSDRRLIAFPLAGVSALALLFLGLTGQHKTRWDVEASRADSGAA